MLLHFQSIETVPADLGLEPAINPFFRRKGQDLLDSLQSQGRLLTVIRRKYSLGRGAGNAFFGTFIYIYIS
jgi:hypothetical protein